MISVLLSIVHIVVCFFLIVVILLQSGKAADLAGAFGGMGSQTAFGPRGSATLLSKATTISAIIFMLTSITLSIMATKANGTGGGGTALQRHPTSTSAPAPATHSAPTQTAPIQSAPAPVTPTPAPAAPANKK